MKILLYPFNFFHQPIAGGERYLERLCNHLLAQGHEIKAVVGSNHNYTHNGIECMPQGEGIDIFRMHNDLCQWCDVIITQLLGHAIGYNKAIQHKKPLIFIAHNNSVNYATRHGFKELTHIIYNSYQLRDDLQKTFGHFNGVVLHPLMADLKKKQGKKITLINCNENKGGHILGEIARRLPEYQFLGVYGGYGDQIECHLPNVTYLQNGCDMNAVYGDTRILLVLSEFESYCQSATEAMQCGIPVISTLCQGVKENLADAGIFISRTDIDKFVNNIVYLMNNDTAYWRQSQLVYDRALWMREKSKEELTRFDKWLTDIIK